MLVFDIVCVIPNIDSLISRLKHSLVTKNFSLKSVLWHLNRLRYFPLLPSLKQYKAAYSMKRMMQYSRPDVGFTIGGCLGAVIAALVNPGFVLLYAEIFQVS